MNGSLQTTGTRVHILGNLENLSDQTSCHCLTSSQLLVSITDPIKIFIMSCTITKYKDIPALKSIVTICSWLVQRLRGESKIMAINTLDYEKGWGGHMNPVNSHS